MEQPREKPLCSVMPDAKSNKTKMNKMHYSRNISFQHLWAYEKTKRDKELGAELIIFP